MSRRWLLFLVCLGCTLPFLGQVSNARFEVRVDEGATRIYFRELAPEVSLVVVNGAKQPQRVHIRLQLLAPNNHVDATTERVADLTTSTQKISFILPTKTRDLVPSENSQILWYRLHYLITADNPNDKGTVTEGFISLSEITPDLFKLQVIGPANMVPGGLYAPRVRATHPLTHTPFKNVKIKGVVSGYDSSANEISLVSSAVTDSDGVANLKFNLPAGTDDDDFDLTVEGTLGLVTIKAQREIDVYNEPTLIVSTDKPIYQPGQTVHARILMLGPSKRALANQELELEIEDPEATVVSQSILTTSRFGIASAEWKIPENSRLGDYELEFSKDDGDFNRTAVIKVSRYDLPNFAVNANTDRPYYLPGQNATVEIKADYLFGKPVSKGHVRLVRETERTWDYEEQKYETVEGDKYEGDTQDGLFKAQIDLTEDHASLKDEDYNRFTDLPYVAYFTDPTTNRTERRQFNIRLTKQAIHIYVVRQDDAYYEYRNLPFDIYVSTFYADGSPAPSNVSIRAGLADGSSKILRQVKTNRYGVAKVPQLLAPDDRNTSKIDLLLEARDSLGRTGTHADTVPIDDEQPAIKVATRKSLLATGEPIEITVASTEQDLPITLTISRESDIIKTTQLKLRNGRAGLVLPYTSGFKDELTINAYGNALDDEGDEQLFWGSHAVLYPRKRNLNVNFESLKTTYTPGEQAHVSFRASGPEGRGIETALGVVITDKAVDERIRSDEGLTSRYTSFTSWIGLGNTLGSISRKALDQIDMSRPVPADLALVAEVILNQGRSFSAIRFDDDEYATNPASVFETLIGKDIKPLVDSLTRIYEKDRRYPTDLSSLQSLLSTVPINFGSIRDPWGGPYRSNFYFRHEFQYLSIECAGADKKFDTSDDFSVASLKWPYFRATGEALNDTVNAYHKRTGDYIRDLETLRTELRAKNIDVNALRNPWNQPYKFDFKLDGTFLQIEVTGRQPHKTSTDEFLVWRSSIDYFAEYRWKIDSTLTKWLKETGTFPHNEAEFRSALLTVGIDASNLRDPWNNNYYFGFHTNDFYGDDARIEDRRTMDQATRTEQIVVRPITKSSTAIRIRSNGPDGRKGTEDDFEVGFFTALVSTQSATDQKPQPIRPMVVLQGSTGAITGTVTDPIGAVVAGATVTAKSQNGDQVFEGTTDDNGKFLIRNIPSGIYEIRASAPGFKDYVISHVIVRSSELIKVDVSLSVGAVAETVSISAEPASLMQTTTASVATTTQKSNLIFLAPGLAAAKQQLFTPRVREYFPETLLWQPQLTTDKKGRAQLDFKLADNITTWRMSVIGSTEDGEIGTAETDIRAFQPFFAELDPPRILTEGDRISLPVALRNYLPKRQSVDVTLRPESWFKVLDSNQRRSEVPGGDSKNEDFNLQTIASIRDGKQQVTAIGSQFSDAIEKPVSVHPDGEEEAETVSDILASSTSLNVNLPANTVPNSVSAEVKIYPHLMTHVWESVEGIMRRPYGCGEQTISSTYPSLMVLRYLKTEKLDSPVAAKAKRYVEEGYQRLLGYQAASGGFAYWANSPADVALTAYALRFLHDASQVTTVNSSVSQRAKHWLISQQRSDGSWPAVTWDKTEDPRQTAMLTALAARSLAILETPSTTPVQSNEKTALVKALDFVESRVESVDEPYLIASYSLASSLAGQTARANKANKKLQTLAHAEGSRSYWALETNTPFYGWGLAGRIETTALVVQAFARQRDMTDQEINNLQSRGLLFLIFNKDRFGVWYSTQATVTVLDAILASINDQSSIRTGTDSITLRVNGNAVRNIPLPTDVRTIAPITVDLSPDLRPGVNQLSFSRAGGGSPVSLQIVNTYYVPWQTNANLAHVRAGDSEGLRLQTSFDKLEARVTEEITCRVKAERIGFRGYGMLLAEIGLPPGVDVDRASLDTAVKGSDWSINHYDVLPDRVVVYLWPRAGGSEFTFKFRPRLAMTAKAAPSTIYDYYNPEAKAVVAPGTFVVR